MYSVGVHYCNKLFLAHRLGVSQAKIREQFVYHLVVVLLPGTVYLKGMYLGHLFVSVYEAAPIQASALRTQLQPPQ